MFTLRKISLCALILASVFLISDLPAAAKTIAFDGLIEPFEVVDIGAPAEGIVAEVTVDRGSLIKKGQVLVKLESSVERAALDKARSMATFTGDINLQQAQLAYARRVHRRVNHLSVISAQDKDQAATGVILSGYRLQKAHEKQILAELEMQEARAKLARRSIKSPLGGVVVERYVSPGEYVNTQPLLRVAQIDPLRVEVIVPAALFGRIRPGMTATVVPEIARFGERTATVTIVDRVIDAASNTFGVRLELPNGDHQMPSGLKCQVRFEIQSEADDVDQAMVGTGNEQTRN
jgi:RND family efflux transporter MFP subunit